MITAIKNTVWCERCFVRPQYIVGEKIIPPTLREKSCMFGQLLKFVKNQRENMNDNKSTFTKIYSLCIIHAQSFNMTKSDITVILRLFINYQGNSIVFGIFYKCAKEICSVVSSKYFFI